MRSNRWALRVASLALSVAFIMAACASQRPLASQVVGRPSNAQLAEAYGRLPLHFEENRGQADPSTRFIARGGSGPVLLGATGLELAIDGHPVRLSFAGRTAQPGLHALDPLPGRANYYIGSDPTRWRTDIPTFARIRYEEVYPGIDIVVYGNQRQLEYDFVVAPGADPRAIRVRVDGADDVTLDAAGDVFIRRGSRMIVQRAPVVYQQIDGRRELVAARYRLAGAHELAFDIGSYDLSRPLIIDPVVVYSARIGVGTASGIAVDSAGFAYFAGENTGAFNNEYPMVNAAFPQRVTGLEEIFVTKLSPDGATLIYSTYIGSSFRDFVNGIATDGAGNAYITGRTHSGYPTTTGAFQPTTVGGSEDGSVSFVTKFGPTGALVYSTFLDGTTFDNPADPIRGGVCYQGEGNSIAADTAGNAYVVGWTSTNNFPTTPGAFIPTKPTTGTRCNTYPAGYLTKLSPDGASLVYSTYLDGNGAGLAVAIDGAGDAYVGGSASTPSAPPGALTASLAASGATTGFYVAKFNPAGFPTQTTVTGASPQSISVGTDGSTYIAGSNSLDLMTVNPIQTTPTGGGFAARLNPSGTAWMWSTYLSGSMTGIGAAPDASAWVVGVTSDDNFPTKDPLRAKTNPTEAVVLRISPTGSLLFSSPLGDGAALGVDLDNAGDAYITGRAGADFMATTPGAYSAPPSGGFDVFVLKLNSASPSNAPPTVTITQPSSGAWTGNSIVVGASATAAVGLVDIKLWADGAVFATFPCSGTTCNGTFLWITGPLPAAAYEVNAVATDTAGNQTISAKVTIIKDATSPVKPSGATTTGGGGTAPPPLTATISSPGSGTTVSGNVTVSMAAGNAGSNPLFELRVDNGNVLFSGAPGGATVSTPWSTTAFGNGTHTLNLKVTDGGRTATAAVTVTVNNPTGGGGGGDTTVPTVSITTPSGTVWTGNSIVVGASAADNVGLVNIKLWANGGVFATFPCSGTTCSGTFLWITGPLPAGAYEVNAVATDTAGNQTISAKVTIIKDATSPVKPSGAITTAVNNPPGGTGGTGGDTTAPNVVITGPSNGAWTGNSIDVSASATDNVGLATLKFFGNGTQFAQVSCSGTSCASTQLWITGPLPDGKHTITVVATDTAGNNTVSAPVVINK